MSMGSILAEPCAANNPHPDRLSQALDHPGDPALWLQLRAAAPRQRRRTSSHLSNGKASGPAGWPTDLPWHATYQLREGWSQCQGLDDCAFFASFLHACCSLDRLPACIRAVLVTPVRKKGARGDPTKYRPPASGELLYRLYSIITNDKLVLWPVFTSLSCPSPAPMTHSPSLILAPLHRNRQSHAAAVQVVSVICAPPEGFRHTFSWTWCGLSWRTLGALDVGKHKILTYKQHRLRS